MRILVDTHIFLWHIAGDTRMPVVVRDAILDPNNEVYLSAASVWEAVIKHSIGKLPLPADPATYLPRQREAHKIAGLPVEEPAFVHLSSFPPIHRDPFDRILIAQTLQHGMTLATFDALVRKYQVPVLP